MGGKGSGSSGSTVNVVLDRAVAEDLYFALALALGTGGGKKKKKKNGKGKGKKTSVKKKR
jgi:hypothetical protein